MDDSLEKEDESPTIPVSVQEEVDTNEHTDPFVFQNSNDVADLPAESEKRKAIEYYNMRCRCKQCLTWHLNQEIEITETAKFEQSLIIHVIT